ncbi:MAG: hypothetical protein AB7K68_10405 [Bacteriovoracia bacterium]
MKFHATALLCLVLTACGAEEPRDQEISTDTATITENLVAAPMPGDGRLNQTEFKSLHCVALVSSSNNPARVLASVKCDGFGVVSGDYVLECQDNRLCVQRQSVHGGQTEAVFSENFMQMILTISDSNGKKVYSDNFVCEKGCALEFQPPSFEKGTQPRP